MGAPPEVIVWSDAIAFAWTGAGSGANPRSVSIF